MSLLKLFHRGKKNVERKLKAQGWKNSMTKNQWKKIPILLVVDKATMIHRRWAISWLTSVQLKAHLNYPPVTWKSATMNQPTLTPPWWPHLLLQRGHMRMQVILLITQILHAGIKTMNIWGHMLIIYHADGAALELAFEPPIKLSLYTSNTSWLFFQNSVLRCIGKITKTGIKGKVWGRLDNVQYTERHFGIPII